MSDKAIDMRRKTVDYERGYSTGYSAGLQRGLEEVIKQKELDISPIYFCYKCAKELKIDKGED